MGPDASCTHLEPGEVGNQITAYVSGSGGVDILDSKPCRRAFEPGIPDCDAGMGCMEYQGQFTDFAGDLFKRCFVLAEFGGQIVESKRLLALDFPLGWLVFIRFFGLPAPQIVSDAFQEGRDHAV
jgi:hypothetical protein